MTPRRRPLPRAAAAVGAVVLAGGVIAAVALLRWNRETARATAGLLPDSAADDRPLASIALRVESLPGPVRRYFAFALAPDQRLVRRARVTHVGEFAMRPGVWSPFRSVEIFAVRPRGFVWDAAVRLTPALPEPTVRVRDGYTRGEGTMRAAVAGLVPVVNQRGGGAMAEASLQRYLAEAVWLPTALLPDEDLVWTAIDDRTARATLTDHGVAAAVDFHFGERGEIVGVTALRGRVVGGRSVTASWVGHFAAYERVAGMMVPTTGDVGWDAPEGHVSYWRARVEHAEYEWADSVVASHDAPPR